jgi:two-component system, sensor histidine kinase YesM
MRQKIKQKAKLLAAINLAVGAAGMCGAWFLYGNLKNGIEKMVILCVYLAGLVWVWLKSIQIFEKPFDRLMDDADEAFQNKYKAETMRTKAEMHALQSQINPHFLYNTLENIRATALMRDAEDIAVLTEALSAMFRYSISSPGETAAVREELKNVNNYLLIQKYRFPGKIHYYEEIEDPEILDYRLPVLTIQPIIENAVNHGVEMCTGEGCIRFKMFMTDYHLVMRISDNGVGMDEITLKNLREKLDNSHRESRKNGKSTGIGLYNVDQRLKFYFGNTYGLNVMSTKNVGTVVEVMLPLNENRSIKSCRDMGGQ